MTDERGVSKAAKGAVNLVRTSDDYSSLGRADARASAPSSPWSAESIVTARNSLWRSLRPKHSEFFGAPPASVSYCG